MAEDEIEALQAIYCGHGEFHLIQRGDESRDSIFSVSVQCESEEGEKVPVRVTFTLQPPYPTCTAQISLHCPLLTKDATQTLKQHASAYAQRLQGEPMILDLIMWIQENYRKYSKPRSAETKLNSGKGGETLWTYVLHLDHMRAKNKYIKTIQKWTNELGLTGRLLFWEKLIFIILQGPLDNIKEYITRQKTVSVDVDSKGRSCKERMLSTIAEQPLHENKAFSDFQVMECPNVAHLHAVFQENDIGSLYEQYIIGTFTKA